MSFCCLLHCVFYLLYLQVLLELGADPRIIADDGANPEQVSVHILCTVFNVHVFSVHNSFMIPIIP